MAVDLSTYWKNYDPETGVGDPSTPLAADFLNEWGGHMEQVRADVEALRNQAQDAAEAATAPTDAMIGAVLANPGSAAREVADSLYAPISSALATSPNLNTTVHKFTNPSPAYTYTVTTVHTGGQFIPGLVEHIYPDDYHLEGTSGADFKPPRKNLNAMYHDTGFAVLANASGWAVTGNVGEILGAQIKDGVAYHDFGPPNGQEGVDAIGFHADGTSKIYSARFGDTAASMLAEGVVNCFSYGPALVIDGTPVDIESNPQWGNFNTTVSARQILGQKATGEIVLITVPGETGVSGIRGNECAAVAVRHGCHNAVMLDGGGTAQTFAGGVYAVPSSDAGSRRPVPDAVAIRVPVAQGTGKAPFYTVADTTDRDALLATLAEAGVPVPTPENPVYVHRQDAPERYELEVNQGAGWRPVNTGPFAMASGVTTLTATGAVGATRTVTFPTGTFTSPPRIVLTKQSDAAANFILYAHDITTSGFTLGMYAGSGAAQTQTATVYWEAKQW